jgi:hypothetical protein
MSIDALIQAHTEALLANTEAVKLLTLSLAGRTPTAEKPKTEVKVTVKQEEKKEEPKAEEIVEEKDDIPDFTAVPYETVRALVLKIAGSNRAAIQALWAKYEIPNLKVLLDKEDDFSTVNDRAKLEAVYADLQALGA